MSNEHEASFTEKFLNFVAKPLQQDSDWPTWAKFTYAFVSPVPFAIAALTGQLADEIAHYPLGSLGEGLNHNAHAEEVDQRMNHHDVNVPYATDASSSSEIHNAIVDSSTTEHFDAGAGTVAGTSVHNISAISWNPDQDGHNFTASDANMTDLQGHAVHYDPNQYEHLSDLH